MERGPCCAVMRTGAWNNKFYQGFYHERTKPYVMCHCNPDLMLHPFNRKNGRLPASDYLGLCSYCVLSLF